VRACSAPRRGEPERAKVSPNTGAIDGTGLYTAPATVANQQTVTATSVADATKSASATVTLYPPVVISSLSSASATAGAQIVVSGSGFGATQGTGYVWLGSTLGTVVSWSDTQITATVASNAVSGIAQVQQWGLWSNTMPLTVGTATITNVSPASAAPGAWVTITGSGFGASQGSGNVWLGGAMAAIQSSGGWSDGQIVAQVATGATGTGAQVLQNGVMSNVGTFTVDALHLTSVGPTPGSSPPNFTLTGTGFGGSGTVWLGDRDGGVVSWSDTQVVATVDPLAKSGVAKIQQNGVWSNAINFSVPASGGGGNTVVPSVINMVVGDTHTIQALNSSSQPVTGLTWTSGDPTVVSLSTDDPPILTAVAAGNVTITAGTGSADVTVYAGSLPLGTVIWSNPGDGSGVGWIVPAVPSASGVADVFAFQNDHTVAAITSDGTTAWTADLSSLGEWRQGSGNTLPDFQGGLVVTDGSSVWKLDGMTGQVYPKYTVSESVSGMAVHPDGTIFALDGWDAVVGIDPTTGTAKFRVPVPSDACADCVRIEAGYAPIIAGDGYFYFPYSYPIAGWPWVRQLTVLRVNSDGASDVIQVGQTEGGTGDITGLSVDVITNADQGILVAWWAPWDDRGQMAITNGTAVSPLASQVVPDAYAMGGVTVPAPVLQAQDGSFFGGPGIVSFDASGNIRWSVPNDQPQIATADGGVIGQSGITYDSNGNATGQMSLFTQSWYGNAYRVGSIDQYFFLSYDIATSFWAFQGANASGNSTGVQLDLFPGLPTCHQRYGNCQTNPGPREQIYNAWIDLVRQLSPGSACYSTAQTGVAAGFKDGGILGLGFFESAINFQKFVNYLAKIPGFYNGPRSTLSYSYAKSGEGFLTFPAAAGFPGDEVRAQFDPGSGTSTTAVTVTPSAPLKTFWQPGYSDVDATGFGVGINPSNSGWNIYNESVIFHEALHGFTGLDDTYLEKYLPANIAGTGSERISVYIMNNVLSSCQ